MSHISRQPLPSIALVLTTDHTRIPRLPSVIKVAPAPHAPTNACMSQFDPMVRLIMASLLYLNITVYCRKQSILATLGLDHSLMGNVVRKRNIIRCHTYVLRTSSQTTLELNPRIIQIIFVEEVEPMDIAESIHDTHANEDHVGLGTAIMVCFNLSSAACF